MKKTNFVGRFLEEFRRGRLIFPFLSFLMLGYLVLTVWMMLDLFYLSGREITVDQYKMVEAMVRDTPDLKTTVSESMEDSVIVRREFEAIQNKHLELVKSSIK